MKRCLLMVAVALLTASCGSEIRDLTRHFSDAAIPAGNLAVVAAANYTDPIASLASLDLDNNYAVSSALLTTNGSDVVLRSFGGKVYVINRFGADSIQVIDPNDFSIVADYSVGAGSNPQDIWVISDEKAYVTRLNAENDPDLQDDVIIINPLTGKLISSIDFKSYMNQDGDVFSRAAQMVAVDDKLFICLQDLPSNMLEGANDSGKVAVIDINTDTVLKVIKLASRDPADIAYSSLTNTVYISSSGVFNNFTTDVNDSFGGIEAIDPNTLESLGIIIDDANLGGYLSEIRIASEELGFVIVDGLNIASFNPKTKIVLNNNYYTTKGFYLPDFSIDEDGNLFITEMSAQNPGIIILSGVDGSVKAGPIAVGAPPTSITFVGTTK